MELTPAKLAQQYRLQQWIETIRDCKNSGQTVAAWCAENQVSTKSYYYWLRKIRESMCEATSIPSVSNTNETTLIPVPSSIRTPSLPSKANDEQAAIILRTDAVTIEIHSHASAPLIEQMLRSLHYVR
jgi:transposase-like protein